MILYPRKIKSAQYELPRYVEKIKERAFEGNSYLENITLEGENLTTIESKAFSDCIPDLLLR